MSQQPPGGPPAGWYPDPEDSAQQRYWDGAAWTDHRAPRTTSGTAQTFQQAGSDLAEGVAGAFTAAEGWWRQQQSSRALTFADVAARCRDDEPRPPLSRTVELVVGADDIDPIRRVFAEAAVAITAEGASVAAACRLVPNPWDPARSDEVAVLVRQHQVGLLPADVAGEYLASLVALSQRQLLAVGQVRLRASWDGSAVIASGSADLPEVAALTA